MFRRSLVVSLSLGVIVAMSAVSAQAGFWNRKPRAADAPPAAQESHDHAKMGAKKGGAVKSSTRAYQSAMQRMHKNMDVPLAGNPDVDFVRQMIPHHQAALEMARIQQQYGQDERLKKFNDWVIFAQELEIAQMKNWLRRRDNGISHDDANDYYSEAMMRMHHAMMDMRYSGNADQDYVRGMIAHHQGAVDMARIWLREGSDPDLKPLVNDIYDAQTREIGWLQDWQSERPLK